MTDPNLDNVSDEDLEKQLEENSDEATKILKWEDVDWWEWSKEEKEDDSDDATWDDDADDANDDSTDDSKKEDDSNKKDDDSWDGKADDESKKQEKPKWISKLLAKKNKRKADANDYKKKREESQWELKKFKEWLRKWGRQRWGLHFKNARIQSQQAWDGESWKGGKTFRGGRCIWLLWKQSWWGCK